MLVRVGRRNGSLTLEADGRHLLTDALTSAIVVAALVLVGVTGWAWFDPLGAVALVIFLGIEGMRLVRRGFDGLMDRQDSADTDRLEAILRAHVAPDGPDPRISGYHALRHRHVGRDHWVDFHLQVPGDRTVTEGHAIASRIEGKLRDALRDGEGVVVAKAHVEPDA